MDESHTQDMLKALENAAAIMKAAGMDGSDGIDTEKLKNMMLMMQMMNAFNSNETTERDMPKMDAACLKPAYYDDYIHTPAIKTIKSAIPFLDVRYQKYMGIFVKMIELQKLIEMYTYQAKTAGSETVGNWRKNMLLAVRPHMEPEKRQKIDLLLRMIDIKEIMAQMGEMNGQWL